VLLSLLAASAFASYYDFFRVRHYGDFRVTDVYHYYMGSKYAHEVGYFDMYGAALAADDETGRLYHPRDGLVRDLRTLESVSVDDVLADRDRYRGRFSDERWQEWVGDVSFFKERLGPAAWNRILRDRGYNATPTWTMIAIPSFAASSIAARLCGASRRKAPG